MNRFPVTLTLLVLAAVALVSQPAVFAQTTSNKADLSAKKGDAVVSPKTHFVYLIRPLRANFLATITPEEQAIMKEHGLYLQNKLKEKSLILAGPCADTTFGIVLFEAESAEEARKIMENDPAVKGGVMGSELHPFVLSLFQFGYEKKK
jgi:uncharacterized protein YciI